MVYSFKKRWKKSSTTKHYKQITAKQVGNLTHLPWRRHAQLYRDYCEMYESH